MNAAEVAVIIVAVLLGATIKSVTGLGFPIIAIPIISIFAPAETAIAVVALPNAAQNLVMAIRHRTHAPNTVGLGRFAAFGVVGAGIGALLLGVITETVILSVLLITVSLYLVTAIRRPDLQVSRVTAIRWTPLAGLIGGVFQGVAGISGPVVGTWHHALRLTQGAFVLSVSISFFLAGSAQVVVLYSTGLLDGRFAVSALLTVLVLVTIPVGQRLRDRLSGRGFERAVLVLLALSLLAIAADLITSV